MQALPTLTPSANVNPMLREYCGKLGTLFATMFRTHGQQLPSSYGSATHYLRVANGTKKPDREDVEAAIRWHDTPGLSLLGALWGSRFPANLRTACGLMPAPDATAARAPAPTMDAAAKFQAAVNVHERAGLSRPKAVAKVVAENPALHEAYLSEANATRSRVAPMSEHSAVTTFNAAVKAEMDKGCDRVSAILRVKRLQPEIFDAAERAAGRR